MQAIYDLVRLAAARNPGHIAIVDDRTDRRLTYRQLIEEIDAYAAGFGAAGIRPGKIVATVLPNLFEHALAILALHRLGAVPALINARLKPEDVAGLVRHGAMTGAVMMPDEGGVRAVTAALPQGALVVTIGTGPAGTRTLDSCRGDANAVAPWKSPDPEALARLHAPCGVQLSASALLFTLPTDTLSRFMGNFCWLSFGLRLTDR
jgi:acyl-CoA synthetase (AMP-forming)/AMP-acid ligase II